MMPVRTAVIRKYETPANIALVAVHASSITFSNLTLITGKPFIARLSGIGLFTPKYRIPGPDIAGRVEKVSRK